MNRLFPFGEVIRNYRREYLPKDMLAGVTIALVLIPQSMSYAMIAGLSPIYGLYAAALPPIIASVWGRSSLLATGPVAMVSLIVYTSLIPFAKPESPEFISLAIMLAVMVGAIQLFMGFFRLGFIMRFMSHPVLVGFTNAAAIIIASTQIKHLLGIDIDAGAFIFTLYRNLIAGVSETNLHTLGIGVLSFIIIVFGRKIHANFPGAMTASAVSILLVSIAGLKELGVQVVGDIPPGLPSPGWIPFELERATQLLGPAVVIAIIGFMEAMAITRTAAAKIHEKTDMNQELIGQGAANFIGAFFKSYPVSGSFSRTAVNLAVGGKTALSNVLSGVIVIIVLLFFTEALYSLPKATLAAIVISAVVGLVQHSQFLKLYKTERKDGIVALATFVLAFIAGPAYAVFIGVILSLVLFLWAAMSPKIVVLTRNPKTEIFENAEASDSPTCPQILYLRPDFSLFFANAEFIREHILDKAKERGKDLKYILLDMEAVNTIDATGIDEMRSLLSDIRRLGLDLYLANVNEPVQKVLKSSDVVSLLEGQCCLESKGASITMLFNKINHAYCRDVCPHSVFWECETVK